MQISVLREFQIYFFMDKREYFVKNDHFFQKNNLFKKIINLKKNSPDLNSDFSLVAF
jgi:hypothetical protein